MTEPGTPTCRTNQQAYDAGYAEAGADLRKDWPHLAFANAYAAGVMDRQNQHPRNPAYRREDYDPGTWERKPPPIEGLTFAEREAAIREAFMDVLTHLVGATSAYGTFAGNNNRPGVRDTLYTTRLADYETAVERGRQACRTLFRDPI